MAKSTDQNYFFLWVIGITFCNLIFARGSTVYYLRTEGPCISCLKQIWNLDVTSCFWDGILSHMITCNFFSSRYGNLYTEQNVAISGTHTHAGPGGYLQYVIYIVTSLGFVRQSFDALVDGIEKSIIQAHENLRPGSIFINKGAEI